MCQSDGEHACRPWYIDHASIILSIICLYFGENNAGIIGTFAHLIGWFVTQDSVLEDYLLISVRLRYIQLSQRLKEYLYLDTLMKIKN